MKAKDSDSLRKHPGYLGFTSRGVIAIHADWPAYPAEHGADIALASLGRFPEGTTFLPIDDIDRCALLVRVPAPTPHPFDSKGYHVAVWHEDLLELSANRWITGVDPATERGWEEARRQQMRERLWALGATHEDPLEHLVAESPSGEMIPMPLEDIAEFDDEWEAYPSFSGAVAITSAGWAHLDAVLGQSLVIPSDLVSRISRLIESDLLDAAIRDMGVALETRLRERTSSKEFGTRLVGRFITSISAEDEYVGAYVKLVHAELRTAFTFIRNEFAHNLVDLPPARGLALLSRMCWVYELIRPSDDE